MPFVEALSCPGRGRRKILHSHGLPALWSNTPDCCERLARPCTGKPPSTFALPCPGPLGQTGLSPESCTVAPPRFGPRQAGHQIQAGLDIMDLKDADFSICPAQKVAGSTYIEPPGVHIRRCFRAREAATYRRERSLVGHASPSFVRKGVSSMMTTSNSSPLTRCIVARRMPSASLLSVLLAESM